MAAGQYGVGPVVSGSGGTVTSVGLAVPAILSVANSPITTSGSITLDLATQVKNLVFAGPASGADAKPTFRSLVADDIANSIVIGKLITGYSSGAGTVAGTDTVLQAINKLNGNDALNLPLAGGTLSGDLKIGTAGKGLFIKEGSNAYMGVATLVGGTKTISNAKITASSRVFLSCQVVGGVQGMLSLGTVVAATSFDINSSNVADTSVVAWMIVEPA